MVAHKNVISALKSVFQKEHEDLQETNTNTKNTRISWKHREKRKREEKISRKRTIPVQVEQETRRKRKIQETSGKESSANDRLWYFVLTNFRIYYDDGLTCLSSTLASAEICYVMSWYNVVCFIITNRLCNQFFYVMS